MHLLIAIWTIFAAWKWGDWRNWKKYQSTMLYMGFIAMVYEFLTKDYTLWRFHPDFLLNNTIVILVYAVITMPLSILVFLSNFPAKTRIKQIFYFLKWVAIYATFEFLGYKFGRISYEHGWNMWWSLLFDFVMFPMLLLHYKKPLIVYPLSIIIITGYMLVFKVPVGNE